MPPPQLSHSSNQVTCDKGSTLKVYQVWKGSNKFCLGGRLIFGPDARSLFYTVFLIVVPVTLFCTFVSENLIHEFQPHVGYLIVVLCVVLTIYDIVLLFLTSATDPGIIPRSLHPPEPEDGSNLSTDWLGNDSQRLPSTKDVMVNDIIVRVKYCQTCMLYRPPRCSHCSICNNCVERFDHHCPWVGQCIGKRNYRFYFMFVSSTAMLCLYVFAFCLVNFRKLMHKYHCNVWRAFLKSPVSGILIIYTCLTAWFVGGLTAFHLYLISTNQTTYENTRYGYDRKMNPYNLGCLHNFLDIFFSKIPLSKNNFRAKIEENSSMVHTRPMSMSHPMSSELPKQSIDVEMGRRQAVEAEDFEDLQTHIESVGGLERCRAHPRPINCDRNMNWEMNPDLHMYAAKFEVEHSSTYRQKIHISQ